MAVMILALPTAGQPDNGGFLLEAYTDLEINRHSRVAITLEPNTARSSSDTIEGGEDIILR